MLSTFKGISDITGLRQETLCIVHQSSGPALHKDQGLAQHRDGRLLPAIE
jgi:hypothetical protein